MEPQQPLPVAPAYPAPSPYGKATGPRSGFWRRFGASFVDGLVIGVPAWIVIGLLFGFHIKTHRTGSSASINFGASLVYGLLAGLIVLVYTGILEGGPRGQTVGKRALGIRVIDAGTGSSIGYPRGFGRAGGKFLFNLLMNLCFVGVIDYLWMLWDKENQTLHDKMVGSYVVPVAAYPVEP